LTNIDIQIREPGPKDFKVLGELLIDQWDYHCNLDSVYYKNPPENFNFKKVFIDRLEKKVLVAVKKNKHIGFVVFEEGVDSHGDTKIRKFIEILELFVDKEYRGLGIGAQLLKAVEEKAGDLGYKWVKFYCSSFNTLALDFYDKSGYVERQRLYFKKLD